MDIVKAVFWASFILIVYTYLIYPLILILIRTKRRKAALPAELPFISLVVSAYNEEKVIREKVLNSLALDYPKDRLEIIIASDGSSDNTDAIIDEYRDPVLRHIRYEDRSGKVNVLNRVIPQAKGDIVVLSDANTIYRQDAIKNIARNFAEPKIGCVCGKLELLAPENSTGGEMEGVYWKYENLLKEIEGERGALLGANGGIYAFRKRLFRRLPSDTIVDDFVIPMNILIAGYKVVFEMDAVGYEETSKSIAEEQVRKIRIGAGAYQALLLTFPMLNILKGFPSFAFWSHKVIRWLVPFLIISMLATNLLLMTEPLYSYFYLMQAVLYSSAFVGFLLSKKARKFKLFHIPYYFLSMNWSLLIGFFKFITKTQRVTWQKAER